MKPQQTISGLNAIAMYFPWQLQCTMAAEFHSRQI